jgi:hypothetical protein
LLLTTHTRTGGAPALRAGRRKCTRIEIHLLTPEGLQARTPCASVVAGAKQAKQQPN